MSVNLLQLCQCPIHFFNLVQTICRNISTKFVLVLLYIIISWFLGSGQTLLLANAVMNFKNREISIYFRVRLGLDTFWVAHCGKDRLGGRATRLKLALISLSYDSFRHSWLTQIVRCLISIQSKILYIELYMTILNIVFF